MTRDLHFPLKGGKHPWATSGSTFLTTLNMFLTKHRPVAVCGGIALACTILVAACGGGGTSEGPRLPTTFQAASLAIGQPDLVSGLPNQGGGPSASSLHFPKGLALTPEGGLLVVDGDNNRVLLYSSMPQVSGASANVVLGQPGVQSSDAAVTQTGMSDPWSIAVGAGRMAVAESEANRVLIYDRIPTAGEPAPTPSVVIGQPGFESSGAGCGSSGLDAPVAVHITPEGKLLVADSGNSRLLVWNQIPAAGAAVPAPNLVIGQSDLDHCAFADDNQDGHSERDPGTTLITSRITGRILAPMHVWSDDRRLVVADGFNRILIWNSFPTANFQPADVVLGQSDFTTRFPNEASSRDELPSPTVRSLYDPRGVHSDGTSLAVADFGNRRVLIWSTFPQSNHQPADVVLGHAGFDQGVTNDQNQDGVPDAPNAQLFTRPSAVLFTPDALFVSDIAHHRVLKFLR